MTYGERSMSTEQPLFMVIDSTHQLTGAFKIFYSIMIDHAACSWTVNTTTIETRDKWKSRKRNISRQIENEHLGRIWLAFLDFRAGRWSDNAHATFSLGTMRTNMRWNSDDDSTALLVNDTHCQWSKSKALPFARNLPIHKHHEEKVFLATLALDGCCCCLCYIGV